MARLIYSAIASLDGFINDADGNFDWAAPDDEVHSFVNDLERPIGTYLYGRRMYEVMRFWETAPTSGDGPPSHYDYSTIWKAADKIVYSSSLPEVTTTRTVLERSFDPGAVREMKASRDSDISVGGADLGAQALSAGLVDELQLFVTPVIVGAGTAWLPHDIRLDLELIDDHRFGGGVVYLHYRVSQPR
ncbi:MAG TPA: dihydrofolate reductase family protein [Ilumatobacteraceae bacterium]|nr:dihydrofolate reductase family protein [Ilumatobacteraceae bacterium]